jgi:hypothetical protein
MPANNSLMSALYTVIYQDMTSSEVKENIINIILHLMTTQADALLQQEGSRILNVLVYVLMSSSGNFAGTAKFSIHCQNGSLEGNMSLALCLSPQFSLTIFLLTAARFCFLGQR